MKESDLVEVKKIWYDRSIEVHRFVNYDPEKYWKEIVNNCNFCSFENTHEKIETYVCASKSISGFIKIKNCERIIYICELFTKESKKGFGSLLLEGIKERYPDKTLTVDVYINNLQGVNWYLHKNFIIDKVRQDGDGELETKNFNRFKYRMMYFESINKKEQRSLHT